MISKVLLGFALVLGGGLFDCGNILHADENDANTNLSAQPTGHVYPDTKYGFQVVISPGWEAKKTSFSVAHYNYVFLTINNQRPGLAFEGWPGTWICNNRVTQLQPGEVYISVGYAGSPMGTTMRADNVGEYLCSFLTTNHVSGSSSDGMLNYSLSFFKRGQQWSILACMKEPVTKENRQKVMALLQSIRFVDAPVTNASWAESLAWNELPEKIRDPGNWPWSSGWPAVGQEGEQSGSGMFGEQSALVTNLGSAYSVTFALEAIGEWRFTVKTNGEVESEPSTLHAKGPPPAQWPSDLPGASGGIIDSYWVAPYVQAADVAGRTTLTWFAKDGHVERQVNTSDFSAGWSFLGIPNHPNTVEGINEDWRINLPPEPKHTNSRYDMSGHITGTPDSRVFVHEYHPKGETVAMDVYIRGKKVKTAGPFFRYFGPSDEPSLNDDGSIAILIADKKIQANATQTGWRALGVNLPAAGARVVVLDAQGEIHFQTDCGPYVCSPIVAPNGVGVLLRPNTGTNQNTFMWFTAAGLQRSLEISPNPEFVSWIPETCQSLFSTSVGFQSGPYELIDWNTGKKLWDIPCPGRGEVLAFALTPKLILFSVAEPYPSGIWHKVNESLFQSGHEWVRTFYAVDAQDGKLVARWHGQFPQRYSDKIRDHFLQLGDKLYYVTEDEFTELSLKDIMAKAHGWQ